MNDAIRIDRWLWFARFFKSRSLAAKQVDGGRVRINRRTVAKPSAAVRVGDVLTFAQGRDIRVVRIIALGTRRGPAAEAQALYQDIAAAAPPNPIASARPGRRDPGAGRPTKAERRAIERLRRDEP